MMQWATVGLLMLSLGAIVGLVWTYRQSERRCREEIHELRRDFMRTLSVVSTRQDRLEKRDVGRKHG